MPRLFIGLPLPQSYHDGVADCIAALSRSVASKTAWTKPGNAHVTLKFLGQVDTERISDITAALMPIRFPAFPLQAGGYGCFPNTIRPRAAWVGVDSGSQECVTLAGMIEAALVPLGFGTMKAPMRPHITLGRIKKNASDPWDEQLSGLTAHWPRFTVTEYVLWESVLTPERAVYTALGRFPLTG